MKKWIRYTLYILAALFLLVMGWIYLFLNGNPVQIYQLEKQMKEQLLEQNYKESEISSIEGSYSFKFSTYSVYVKFKNEPKTLYTYTKDRRTGKLIQKCNYYNDSASEIFTVKHREKYCTSKQQ